MHQGKVGREEGRKKRKLGDGQVSGLSDWVRSGVIYGEEKDVGMCGEGAFGRKRDKKPNNQPYG